MTTETNQQEMAGLAGAAAAMISGSAKNLGQLLGVPVDFKLLTIGSSDVQVPEVAEDGVHLSVEFDGALTGDSWLVLDADDAKSIVRIMTQGMDVAEDDLLGIEPAALRFEAGRVALTTGRYAEGAALLERVRAESPDRPNLQYLLGWAYSAAGDEARAREYFTQCLGRKNNAAYAKYCRQNLESGPASAEE